MTTTAVNLTAANAIDAIEIMNTYDVDAPFLIGTAKNMLRLASWHRQENRYDLATEYLYVVSVIAQKLSNFSEADIELAHGLLSRVNIESTAIKTALNPINYEFVDIDFVYE